jgi:sulfite reductase (NADPH) flavoprotein alpha-component
MLENSKKEILDRIIASFAKEEILWASGYLAGSVGGGSASKVVKAIENLTILYISESGNSKFLAGELNKKLKAAGIKAKLKDVLQYRHSDFAKEENLILITSTHGDGEIPESGKKFFEFLNENNLDLGKLKFLTIALGDKNYPLFCEAGKIFENKLIELRASKIANRIELDLDFEEFIDSVFETIINGFGDVDCRKAELLASDGVARAATEFSGKVLANVNLNDVGSGKETHHLEIDAGDEIFYESGDSIGILLKNDKGEKLTPRLYSIASAKGEHGNEIHLTVSTLRYVDENGNEKEGVVSNYLSRLGEGEKVDFYLSKNRLFKLPEDDKDIIMVGPGTGIAPFRSFLFERNSRLAAGQNWLFFGERNFQTDFLYQSELQDFLASGLLTKLDVAFSRDQKEKIYVQNRMKEKAKELFAWLENGAYFYVCGDKENMAKDVENALLEIIANEGGKSLEEAKEYLSNLSADGRYLKDVY